MRVGIGRTPGRLLAATGRHRSMVSIVAVVALVVTIPRLVTEESSTRAAAPRAGVPGQRAGDGGASEGPTAEVGGVDATPGATGGGAPVVDLAAFPGVGTPEALANPSCDPQTGRIRFPSKFAPECVRPWPAGADNGGATSMGVTADSIKLVILMPPPSAVSTGSVEDVKTQVRQTILAFADNYELWGRKLDIKFHTLSGTDEASQRADAIQVFNQEHPFMVSSFLFIGGDTPRIWSTEMAARGVISWDESVTFNEAHAQAGYRWGYSPDDRLNALTLGEYVGKRLANRPARFAGDEDLKGETRSFALVYDDAWDHKLFSSTLQRYGGRLTDSVSYSGFSDLAVLQQQAGTQIARLKARGVNNVIVVAGPVYSGLLTRAATQQGFFPEWTMSGWKLQDVAVLSRIAADQDQWAHAFGIGLVPPLESPITISERNEVHDWAYGRQPIVEAVNGQMYLLAKSIIAGLHLAGPNLSPASFRNAMFSMQPKGGRWCSCVTRNGSSFGRHIPQYPGDKYFDVDDYSEKWWDRDTVGQDEIGATAKGVFQVVDGGQRYLPGDWPNTEPAVFDRSRSTVSYSQTPANDRNPPYPPPPR